MQLPGFLPSTCGFSFPNAFPDAPVITIDVGPAKVPFGNAAGGLCGGMVFAVKDCFEGSKIPGNVKTPGLDLSVPPAPGTPLFTYLCHRLIDSLNLPFGPVRYLAWMSLPEHDVGPLPGLHSRTMHEVDHIVTELEAGRLAPLGLVTVHSANPARIADCHQVLAYGYDEDDTTGALELKVYDPNRPGRDDAKLILGENGLELWPSGMMVRGFFLSRYRAPAGKLP